MNVYPGTDCEGCSKEIGLEPFVVCWDGITSKHVTFHKRCDPTDPDLRRHHGMPLEPMNMRIKPTEIG